MKSKAVLALTACVALAACSPQEERIEITSTVKPGLQDQAKPPIMTTADRLGATAMAAAAGAADGHSEYEYTLPEGWEEMPPAQFRDVNLRVAGQPEAEIYLSVLPAGGGGATDNINRWRRQMGQSPASPEELAALPKQMLFGLEAALVELSGTFSGMGDTTAKDNFKLLGLAAASPEQGYFLKFVGPAAVVDAEREKFLQFAESLHQHDHAEHQHEHEAAAADQAPAVTEPDSAPAVPDPLADGLQWTAPPGWQQAPERQMRLVTFTVEGAPEVECYVSSLGGAAGGLEGNFNRWRQQMGQPPLTAEEMAALPKVTVLGQEMPLLQVSGTFTGMDNVPRDGQMLLGTVVQAGASTLFIKMTGPAPALSGQVDNFIAFCKSLR